MKTFLGVMTSFLLFSMTIHARTIYVPADYSTINAAIDAANNNDEIIVSPGTYAVGVVGKSVTIRSTFDGKDWGIIERTTVVGGFYLPATWDATIRGFRITQDPTQFPPGVDIKAIGINSYSSRNLTIEYCIIENCISYKIDPYQKATGAAIVGVNGIIQNNIIRNNTADACSAMYQCSGTIRNNVFYNNNSKEVGIEAGGYFINNNVFGNAKSRVHLYLNSSAANNILWHESSDAVSYTGPTPRNCVIKGYSGPGTGIITADPKFVDPAHGDFHLQSTSPCIDAGLTTTTIKADIVGVQRGLKGVSETRGDGSCTDIGAYEYKPKPVAVWLPNGGPDEIRAGESVKVAWEMQNPPAGTAITLKLYRGTSAVATLGAFWNANGADESMVTIPRTLAAPNTYTIRGISNLNQTIFSDTPLMSILSAYNAVRGSIWTRYL